MPGRSGESRWGSLPLVVDTSAWTRARHPDVREAWKKALRERQLRLSPLVRLEILTSARDGGSFGDRTALLDVLPSAPFDASIARAAESAMGDLANRSAGAHRIPIVDYFVAAAAEALGGAVLHYDRDYDKLAEVMEFESIWLASPGSMP
jgi:predicted nucleic acid-binding protein